MDAGTDLQPGTYRAQPFSQRAYVALTRDWAEHTVPHQFRRQVERSPEATALKTRYGSLTYEELDKYANRIANAILSRRAPGQEAVCLLLEHDSDVPAAILGVFKTGKFFVALDAGHPRERNGLLIKDAGASLLVTNDRHLALAESLVSDAAQIINIDELRTGALYHDPNIEVAPDDLAYLVYTSGSTGKPKGVIHTHRSSLHSTARQTNGWEICPDDRIGLFFNYNFGACPPNVFGALLTGASLYPFDVKKESPARLLEWLNEEEITFFHIVPTLFRHLVSTMSGAGEFPSLRLIRLAGETVYGSDVRLFQEHFGEDCILQVGMGSAETGAVFQGYFDRKSVCPEGVVPLGHPVEDMEVLLVDDAGQLVKPGDVGEIAVRSRYLFSGYWRRPELTSQVLLPDPGGGEACTYFMRDLGMRLPDGRITHLGRKDMQVKIRGHRVEIGEVELALRSVPGISEAAVVAKENDAGAKKLVAYVVRTDSASMPTSLLRSILKKTLPSYSMPAVFIDHEELPLTASGKVDRADLSARPLPSRKQESSAPRDHLEMQLQAVWEEVLGTKGFGIRDDFFDLGGDSLLALKMALMVEELTGRRVNLAGFPTELTIDLLADNLEASEQQSWQRPILEIQTAGTAPPMFFCHGAIGSGGFFCRSLAKNLGSEQPFLAIPPHGLDGGSFPQTVEAMAADRVQAVREYQPEGPYRLGGFCWGGFVALEMARQLKAQGAEVDALLLIDSDPRDVRVMRPLRRLIHHLGSWFSLSEGTELSWFRKCRRFVRVWNGPGGAYRIATYPIRWTTRKLFRDMGGPDTGSEEKNLSGLPAAMARRSRWPIYHQIVQSYLPERYPGKVVVFQSSDVRRNCSGDPAASWRYITADIETHAIAGDHKTCVTRHVDDLARKMSACLQSQSGDAPPRLGAATDPRGWP
jgi:amino acid adenylation domain-containing protein